MNLDIEDAVKHTWPQNIYLSHKSPLKPFGSFLFAEIYLFSKNHQRASALVKEANHPLTRRALGRRGWSPTPPSFGPFICTVV